MLKARHQTAQSLDTPTREIYSRMFSNAWLRIIYSSPMPDNYFARYLPLLIHLIVAGALASAIVLLSWFIGYRRPTRAKMSPYECGMTPVGDAKERFSVKFYLEAMLFIRFDVEAVFLYAWAVIL